MRIAQNSFVAGELDPALWGRIDLKKYFEGAAALKNFTVQRHGGITKRQGTDLLHDLTDAAGWGTETAGCRIIPFLYDRSTSFVVVLVNLKAYFFRNGLPVFRDNTTVFYVIDTPYEFGDLDGIRFMQSGDTLFLTHPDYRPRTLVRYEDTDWRLSAISFDNYVPVPTGLAATVVGPNGSESGTPPCVSYSWCVSAVIDGQESRPSSSVTKSLYSPWKAGASVQLSWLPVPGAQQYRVYKKVNGSFGYVGSSTFTRVTTTSSVAWALTGGTLIWPLYSQMTAGNLYDGVIDEMTGTVEHHASFCAMVVPGWTYPKIMSDRGATATDQISGVRIALGAIAMDKNGGVSSVLPGMTAITVEGSANASTWVKVKNNFAVPNSITKGCITIPFTPVNYRYWRISFINYVGTTMTQFFVMVREVQLMTSPIAEYFVDDNISPDTNDGPTDSVDPWDDDLGYPSVMTLFQQRSVWAGVPYLPTQVLFSATGNLYSFCESMPQKPDDKIDVKLPLTKPGDIKHLVAMRNMIILTESGEWIVSYDDAKGLAYDTMRMHQNSYFGCNGVPPLTSGGSCLFIGRNGRQVFEYQYQLANDGFAAADRSILSAHLTESATISAWAFQQSPDAVIWCVLTDGTMIALTYMPEHEIWAWSRHETDGGSVLDAIVTGAMVQDANGETGTDETYLLVERGERLYLERMRPAIRTESPVCGVAVCLDCAQRMDLISAQTTFKTTDILPDDAYTVVDLVTGVAQAGTSVAGVMTVATPVRFVMVGKLITSTLETLRPEPQQFSIQTLRQKVLRAIFRLRRAAGGTIGPVGARTAEIAIPDTTPVITASPSGDPDATIALVTGDRQLPTFGYWNREGRLGLTHASHWPFSMLCMVAELDMEGPGPA